VFWLGFVLLKGSPWTACASSGVSNVQAKSSATGLAGAVIEEGVGEGALANSGVFGLEQLVAKPRANALRTTYGNAL
jgi:hypothetical protein